MTSFPIRWLAGGAFLLTCTVVAAQPGPGPRRGRMQQPPAACQQMMADVKASDARFDEQVKRMNETQGTERIDAIVTALNELAARHRTMREHMASMPCMGAGAGCPGGAGCPVMTP